MSTIYHWPILILLAALIGLALWQPIGGWVRWKLDRRRTRRARQKAWPRAKPAPRNLDDLGIGPNSKPRGGR